MGNQSRHRSGWLRIRWFVLALGAVTYALLRSERAATTRPTTSPAVVTEVAKPRADDPLPSREVVRDRPSPGFKFKTQPLKGRAYSIAQNFDAPAGDAADVVARLLPLAEAGDEVAAFEIYRKLDTCRTDFRMARESAPNTEPDALIPAECRSIPIDQWRAYTSRWLEASAERGFVPAQLLYGTDPEAVIGNAPEMLADPDAVAKYRRKAMTYLERAAATGNVDALLKLARAHAVGVLTRRDPTLAYAYSFAGDIASEGAMPPELAGVVTEQYAEGLSRAEIERARQQGKKIYENCSLPHANAISAKK